MEGNRWQELEELYHTALSLKPEERKVFLRTMCEQDEASLSKLESMMRVHEKSRHFLESPAFDASALLDRLSRVEDAKPTALTGKTVSHYHILECVGAGGMGIVYKAEDLRLGRFVALKFLSSAAKQVVAQQTEHSVGAAFDTQALERLQREARAASALDHPNICMVHEVDEWEGTPFIAMQFLSGQTLREEIQGRPIPVSRIVDFGIQIADALDAAHSAGIVHRDVKSANIFVTKRGEIKILDFGIAKLTDATPPVMPSLAHMFGRNGSDAAMLENWTTVHGNAPGTLAYMSPEQVCGEKIDGRTDIFSCGVVLYEMATGRLPFQGETSQAIAHGILHELPLQPSLVNSAVPSELQSIITKAITKDRDKRYQTAAQLRDDLRRLKSSPEPGLTLAEDRTVPKVWKFAAATVIFFITAISTYLLLHRRSNSARFAERGSVVLADSTNNTGDSVFDGALKQALRVQLEQSPYLNVTSDLKISEQLQYMGRVADARLTNEVARESCLRLGADAELSSSISRVGDRYVVGIEAVNCKSGEVLASEQGEAEGRDRVLPTLDSAATRLRIKLGESLVSVREHNAPVEQATTTSLEALQAYSLALAMRSPEGEKATIPYLERATQLDPKFAMAYARLGVAYTNLNIPAQGRSALERAYQLRDRVSQRERFYIESHYYDIVTGEYDKAIQTYELWLRAFPNDLGSYVNLGTIYSYIGEHQRDADAQLQALRIDPNFGPVYVNLANAYICLNQIDKAKNILAEARARKLLNTTSSELRYEMAFLEGDQARLEDEYQNSLRDGDYPVLALQADTEAYYGRLAKARALTQRAIALARRHRDLESAVGYQVIEALREADFGNLGEARRQAIGALPKDPDANTRALIALVLANTGAGASARAIAHQLSHESPTNTLVNSYWVPTILAATELRKNPNKALELLDAAEPYELGLPQTATNALLYPIYIRGLAFLAGGDGQRGAHEFQKIVAHPGIVGNYPLGALAYLGLARAYALQLRRSSNSNCGAASVNCAEGRSPRSPELLKNVQSAYRSFFVLWKNADPGVPVLKQAKAEYAKLQ